MQTTGARTILRSGELACPSCIRKLERARDRREGIARSEVHFSTGRIEVHHDPRRIGAEELADAVRAVGYQATPSEALVATAAVGAVVIGELREAAATFPFAFGRALGARTLRRTRGAPEGLPSLLPREVRVVRGDEERTIAPHGVAPGDVVVVRPGGRVPVDGCSCTRRRCCW